MMHGLIGRSLAVAALVGSPLLGQVTGTVQGTVTLQENSGVVRGAVILVVGAGLSALTDEQGEFRIDGVLPGSYEVIAQRENLAADRETVDVESAQATTVNFSLDISPVREHVTVTATPEGTATALEAFNAVSTLDSFDMTREAAVTLGDALANEPGIAVRSFGPGANRPIIRGFDADRVLILENGIRTGDLSSTSGDHGVAVDPNSAERIEVVRGPATLLYGANAIGGLINVITPQATFQESPRRATRAQLSGDLGSPNSQAGTNFGLQHSRNSLHFWGGGSMRRTQDYYTPLGIVENSAIESRNARAGVGWSGDRMFANARVTLDGGRYGVPVAGEFHVHHDDHDDRHEEEAGEHDDEESEMHEDGHHGETAIALDWQRRTGRLDFGFHDLDNSVVERVRFSLNVMDWQHEELEAELGMERVGTRYENRTYVFRADADQRHTARLTGRFGAWSQVRDFSAQGFEALAPRTSQSAFAVFAYEQLAFGRFRVQFGARAERDSYRPAERVGGHDDHDDGPHIEEMEAHMEHEHEHEHELELEAPATRDRTFTGLSASVGLHSELGAGNAVVANLTQSHRAPGIEELYNFGPHAGTLAFDIGNPDLNAENSLGFDLSLRHRSERVRGELNFFVYDIGNFIFGDRTDQLASNLPVFNILQGDSRFIGFDARGSVRLPRRAWATLSLGRVDARLTPTDLALPRIPPLRGTLSLDIPYRGLFLSPRLTFAARQDNVYLGETATERYAVFDLRASYVWARDRVSHILSFTASNLTNELYRNHTSFIKDRVPEMGRGVRVSYSFRFH